MAAAIHEERRLIRHPTLWREAALQSASTAAATPLDVAAVPHEVLVHVASYLDAVQDLLSFGAVCKATQLVSLDEALWSSLCRVTFPLPTPDRVPPGGWKALYRCVGRRCKCRV
jgi:hypothetical protein